MKKKMAILTVTPEAIRKILCLPDGSTLIDLKVSFEQPGVLLLKIEGAGWDISEGEMIQTAIPGIATKDKNGNLLVDWGLPTQDTEDNI